METELCAVAPKDWRVLSLEDVCARVTSGGTPSRRDVSYYVGGTWPWIKTQELQDKWIDRTEESITDRAVAESSAKVLPANTVLVAMYGATVGQLGLLRRPMTCNQACCALVVDENSADYRFVFYQLLLARSQLKSLATGAAQQNLSGVLIRSLRFPFPSLAEQRAIAHILGTLDDKIELNRRMSETLEAMARALFKSWFVDFDPVRAKMENRDPGLPQALADLFPARLVHSELGEIPEGWEVGRVADIGSIVCGKTPSTQQPEYYGDDIPFITIPDMHGKLFAVTTQRRLSRAGAASQRNKLLSPGAICVSCIATPGLVVITTEAAQTNQQINSVIPSNKDQGFFWYWILRELGDEIRASGSGGSVLSNLSTGRFADLRVLLPKSEIRSHYHSRVAHLFDRILATERETIALVALRDTLLPKLISGELRLADAEKLLESAP